MSNEVELIQKIILEKGNEFEVPQGFRANIGELQVEKNIEIPLTPGKYFFNGELIKNYNDKLEDKKKNFVTVEEYFNKGKFVIPNYQRGYKWSVPHKLSKSDKKNISESSVTILLNDLFCAFQNEYFLQGVTVSENENGIEIIDGQQRTTTIYLLLFVLSKKLSNEPDISNKISTLIKDKIIYDVRKDSNNFLNNKDNVLSDYIDVINNDKTFNEENKDDCQDIYYFKEAIKQISLFIKNNQPDLSDFSNYILSKVKFIYIRLDKEKAVKAFTMLNGQKAVMSDYELIKASLLSKASRNLSEKNSVEKEDLEWEIKTLRSRYASEWDRWLYWWNRNDVKFLYGRETPLKLLLDVFFLYYNNNKIEKISSGKYKEFFKAFKDNFLKDKKDAKVNFLKLRKLQKHFEDWFKDVQIYNSLGLIFNAGNVGNDKINFVVELIRKYEKNPKDFKKDIWDFAKWNIAGVTYDKYQEYIKSDQPNETEAYSKILNVFKRLSFSDVYYETEENKGAKEQAFKQLFRINVEYDNRLTRKFDFSIYLNRSLEHIHAKSKEGKLEEFGEFSNQSQSDELNTLLNEKLSKENIDKISKLILHSKRRYGVNCIGNLVLLDKNDNSALGPKEFVEKKDKLFILNGSNKELKRSLNLLHTLSIFSKSKWDISSIKQNYYMTLLNIYITYNLGDKE